MKSDKFPGLDRRKFLKKGLATMGVLTIAPIFDSCFDPFSTPVPLVSIVKIKDDKVDYAVEKAIDLLGGIEHVTRLKQKIMLNA